MKEVKNRHIVVIGGGRSGVAAASLLKRNGACVFVTDNNTISQVNKARLNELNIPFEEQKHSEKARKAEFGVLSPGVATEASLVQKYLQAGKKVYSEIEVASWFNESPVIA